MFSLGYGLWCLERMGYFSGQTDRLVVNFGISVVGYYFHKNIKQHFF